MKKSVLLLLMTFAMFRLQAQDIIFKKNGEEIKAKLVEISPEMIKYKEWDNQRGPDISIYRKDVIMIKYENGTNKIISTTAPESGNIYIVNPKPASVTTPVTTPKPVTVTPQPGAEEPLAQEQIKLSGPRFGVTYIAPGELADKLDTDYDAEPVISQFGWQFETKLFTLENGPSGLIEFVPLIGGLEQGLFLPSASFLMGIRGQGGFELGAGPNFSLAGTGVVVAAGTSYTIDNVHFPVNVAVVPSKEGTRYSLTFGFNYRRR